MRFFGEATGRGEVRAMDRTVAMYSGLEYGVFNISLLTRPAAGTNGGLDAALSEAARYFNKHTKRWSFWLCEDLLDPPTRRKARQICNDFGLRPISYPPGMMAPKLLPPVRPLPAIECRPVNDPRTRTAFAEITSDLFRDSSGNRDGCLWSGNRVARGIQRICRDGGRQSGGYRGDGAGGGRAGDLFAGDDSGGAPSGLRRGAAAGGGGEVPARRGATEPLVLQSTEAGHALYRRMGFRDVTKFTVYLTR